MERILALFSLTFVDLCHTFPSKNQRFSVQIDRKWRHSVTKCQRFHVHNLWKWGQLRWNPQRKQVQIRSECDAPVQYIKRITDQFLPIATEVSLFLSFVCYFVFKHSCHACQAFSPCFLQHFCKSEASRDQKPKISLSEFR